MPSLLTASVPGIVLLFLAALTGLEKLSVKMENRIGAFRVVLPTHSYMSLRLVVISRGGAKPMAVQEE